MHTGPTRPRSAAAGLLRALTAAVVLAALVGGAPYALWHWGTLPTTIPDAGDITDTLTSPDDGSLLLTVLTLAAWALWAALLIALVLEAGALLQRRTARRRRGLAGLQGAAAWLLGSLIVLSGPTVASAAAAPPAAAAQHSPAHETFADAPARGETSPQAVDEEQLVHRVTADNPTLWGIAEERLGDGRRHKELRALNPQLPDTVSLPPGTEVYLPADAPPPNDPKTAETVEQVRGDQQQPESYRVEPGDTLWGIADTELGDPTRYPDIAQANPEAIDDPDLIYPGQRLTLPSSDGGPQTAAPPRQAPETDPPAEPSSPPVEPSAPEEEDQQRDGGLEETTGSSERDDTGWEEAAGDRPAEETTPPAAITPPEPNAEHSPAVPHAETPTPSAAPPTASTSDSGIDRGVLAATGVGVLAASFLGVLAGRRIMQQRSRTHGRRIALPTGRAEETERRLRSVQVPEGLELVDACLRTMAVHLLRAERALPALAAVQLGEQEVTLHLAEPVEPVAPFAAQSPGGTLGGASRRWTARVDTDELAEAALLRDVEAPYPGLVSLGWDAAGALLLVDVERVGTMQLTGTHRQQVLRTLAVELSVSQLADHLDLAVVGDVAPGLEDLMPERVTTHPRLDPVVKQVTAQHHNQQQGLADRADGLQAARLEADQETAWTPLIVLAGLESDTEHGDTAALDTLLEVVTDRPRSATAIITLDGDLPADHGGVWRVDTSPNAVVPVPDTDLVCTVQVLTDTDYADILQLAATTYQPDYLPATDHDQAPAPRPASQNGATTDHGPDTASLASVPVPGPRETTIHDNDGEERNGDGDGALVRAENGADTAHTGGPDPASSPESGREPSGESSSDAGDVGNLLAEFATYTDDNVDPDSQPEATPSTAVPGGDALPPVSASALNPAVPVGPDYRPTPAPGHAPEPAGPSAGPSPAPETVPDYSGPRVLVLGPVDIVGARGTITSARRRGAVELAAWIALHPGRDHHALDDALWPGQIVDRKSRNPRVSQLRSWLGIDDNGHRYLPHISQDRYARYAFTDQVTCDWNDFQRMARDGERTPGPNGDRLLRAALNLVRGAPFEAVNPRRYAWAEHITQDMIAVIVDTAAALAERYLDVGDPRGALWAATKGLETASEAEQLHRIVFRAHHALGDMDGLERAARRLDDLLLDLQADPEQETAILLRSLLSPTNT